MAGFKPTTAVKKILAMEKRIRVIPGGQGAGKTYALTSIAIDECICYPDHGFVIAGGELTKMKLGVVKDFERIMKATGNWHRPFWNKSTSEYSFPNGSFIKFLGLDADDIGKSTRVHGLYVIEANRGISFEAYHGLASRVQDVKVWDAKTNDYIIERKGNIFIDFNPDAPFWVHTMVMKLRDGVITNPDVEQVVLTFMDNEELSQSERDVILQYKIDGEDKTNPKWEYWWNKWIVYGLGQTGKIDGLIYPGFSHVDEVPDGAQFVGYGIDFGFSDRKNADQSTIVGMWARGNERYVKEYLYATGVLIDDMDAAIRHHCTNRNGFIVGDGGGGGIGLINQYKARGIPIIPVSKSGGDEGSIWYGIKLMENCTLFTVGHSPNLDEETREYRKDPVTGKPIGRHHALDAMRYIEMTKAQMSGRGGALASTKLGSRDYG